MKGKFASALSLAVIVAMLFTSVGLADNVQNDVVVGGNDTIITGGSTTVNYRVAANNGDGESGCNATEASPGVVTINAPAGVWATPGSLTFTSCGTNLPVVFSSSIAGNYEVTVSVSDSGAGTYNTNPAKFTLKVLAAADSTPPVISFTVNSVYPPAPDGNNGWYKSSVTVAWSVSDPDSAVVIDSGCGTQSFTNDTATGTSVCSAHSDGGPASTSFNFMLDATAPTLSFGAQTPTANGNGWNNSDVSFPYTTDDNLSGVASATPASPLVLSTEGSVVTGDVTVTDNAGNSAKFSSPAVKIDKTAPVISFVDPSTSAWYKAYVTASWKCSDDISGPVSASVNAVASGEGFAVLATGTCTDNAGNTASDTQSFKIDQTAPTISGSALPAINGHGWNNTDVTVFFTCDDVLSGVASCGPDQTLTNEGAGQSVTGNVVDKAGNTSSATVSGINIDKTAPTVALVGGPDNGASYYFGSVPAAPTCNASDGLSGLNSACSVSGYSSAVGSHTVTTSATDKAGNSTSASATYTVLAWTLKGFYQPVDMSTQTTPVWNTVKGGSTVPLKFEVFAETELTSTSVVKSFTVVGVACNNAIADDIELTTTGGTFLRYDATAGQFVQNWQTPKAAGSCYKVTMTTQDGSFLSAFFKLK